MPRPQGSTEMTDQFQREFETALKKFGECASEGGHEICDCDRFCPVRDECVKFYFGIVVDGPRISLRNHEIEEDKRLKNEIKQATPDTMGYWREQLEKFMEESVKRGVASYFKKIEEKMAEFKLAKLESGKSLESSR